MIIYTLLFVYVENNKANKNPLIKWKKEKLQAYFLLNEDRYMLKTNKNNKMLII